VDYKEPSRPDAGTDIGVWFDSIVSISQARIQDPMQFTDEESNLFRIPFSVI